MKQLIFYVLINMPMSLLGQSNFDANWVFGLRTAIRYSNAQFPQVFNTFADNLEANACISDTSGMLQLYFSSSGTNLGSIRDRDGNLIVNGDSLNVESSATNGALFLPMSIGLDSVYFFHVGVKSQPCNRLLCYGLFCSLITKDNQGKWEAKWKNRLMGNEIIEESITTVRHSNGLSWWLFAHEQRVNAPGSTSNRLIVYEVGNQVAFHHYMHHHQHQGLLSLVGEFNTSDDGKFMFRTVMEDNILYIDRIDRCSGMIQPYDSIKVNLSLDYIYGAEIVNQYVYISYADWATSSGRGGILRYKLAQDSILGPETIFFEQSQGFSQGQLEYGPDGNIWVSHGYYGQGTSLHNKYRKHLSVIQYPSTDSALYTPYYLFVGDSAENREGLPNFPNYNLGPEGVFLASAGKDTFWCSNTGTGAAIGTPPVPNVIYTWQPPDGLSATDIAQPIASPVQSTWYYLTATDTTATSCAMHTDSVYVEVEICSGIGEVADPQAKIYPNPTTPGRGTLTVELPGTTGGVFILFNLLGQRVLEAPLTGESTMLDIDASPGIYLYQISVDGHLQNGKVVVE